MTTARDVMNRGAQTIGEDETLLQAAQHMKSLQIGALPITGGDGSLIGMVTDRDIAVRCVADGADASSTTAGSIAAGSVRSCDADDDIDTVLRTMREHQVKRSPVLSDGGVGGMISEPALVAELSGEQVAHSAEGVYKKDGPARGDPRHSDGRRPRG